MFYIKMFCVLPTQYTVELYLSGLIGTVSHPDMQKIRIIGFLFENRLHWQFAIGCYYVQYVPASKPFDHA